MARGAEGNLCLFLLVRITCMLMFAVGIGVLVDGIYATIHSDRFDYYTGGVIIFGVVILLLSALGYLNRSNPFLLILYLSLLFLVFLALTGLTIIMILDPQLVDRVGGETNANYLRYSLLCAAVVALIAVLLACCYRSSLLVAVYKERREADRTETDLGKEGKTEALVPRPVSPSNWRDRKKRKADKVMENFVNVSPNTTEADTDMMKGEAKAAGSDGGKKPMIIPVHSAQKPKSSNPFPS